MANQLHIEKLYDAEQMAETEDIIRITWNTDHIPLHQSLATINNGGIILGAYLSGKMVGYLYSFPGFSNDTVYLWSHLLAVLPEHRGQNVGAKLKLKQAEIARELGYSSVRWTFDPLESRNAHLNLNKLRARGTVYSPNYYGNLQDDINKGLPSDRLIIEWALDEQPLEQVQHVDERFVLLESNDRNEPIETQNLTQTKQLTSDKYYLEIPVDIQAMKKENIELAIKWRLKTRHIFVRLFNKGYQATDVILSADRMSCYYVLRKLM